VIIDQHLYNNAYFNDVNALFMVPCLSMYMQGGLNVMVPPICRMISIEFEVESHFPISSLQNLSS